MTDVHFPAGSGRYLCLCPDGRQGALCDEAVDECASTPCAAGQCVSTVGGYRCECPPGLRGEKRQFGPFSGLYAPSRLQTCVCVCVFVRFNVFRRRQRV